MQLGRAVRRLLPTDLLLHALDDGHSTAEGRDQAKRVAPASSRASFARPRRYRFFSSSFFFSSCSPPHTFLSGSAQSFLFGCSPQLSVSSRCGEISLALLCPKRSERDLLLKADAGDNCTVKSLVSPGGKSGQLTATKKSRAYTGGEKHWTCDS